MIQEAEGDSREEPILEPDLPIIDPHHHFYDGAAAYLPGDLRADLASGHNVLATLFVECSFRLLPDGPAALRSLGETAAVAAVAETAAPGLGIIGFVDLGLGDRAMDVLERHVEAARGRLVGIRHVVSWDPDPQLLHARTDPPEHLMLDPDFRAGFACLAPLGLAFDAWLYQPQIAELTDLARAFPGTTIVLDHLGGPLGIGRFAEARAEAFASWRRDIEELARCPNVVVKLGGLGMRIGGFGLFDREAPASSAELAAAWRPHVEVCLAAFGPERCMFESNFPVDREACGYAALWNAFKHLAAGCSSAERACLFSGTARTTYGLDAILAS